MIPRKLLDVIPTHDYKLILCYENNKRRVFDVKPYISGLWYGQLENTDYFKQVRISNNTVVWPDGQDIAPHELYEE